VEISSGPLPKSRRCVHNARPAKERSARAGRTWRRRTKKELHKVLTSSETALECAAPLTGRPPGRNAEGSRESPSKGVDESKNRAIMGGSPQRKLGRNGRRDRKSTR